VKPLSQPLRWVGGKRQLLPVILTRLPARIDTYYEPFAGGAAVFFALARAGRFRRAVLGDTNALLVNTYVRLRDNLNGVLDHLRTHAKRNGEKYFYQQRKELAGDSLSIAAAARFIYLNRTCYNGLYRVNKVGAPNMPYGHLAKPRIYDADGLEAASRALKDADIFCADFAEVVISADKGDAVFFDSPYVPVSKTASFRAFDKAGFNTLDQERLADVFGSVAKRGCRVLLSNSDTIESRRIYGVPGNTVEVVGARRNINSDASKRGAVGEILVSVPVLEVKRGKRAA
jgi:DNA adenine methylase